MYKFIFLVVISAICNNCVLRSKTHIKEEQVVCIKKLYLTKGKDYKNIPYYSITNSYIVDIDGSTNIVKTIMPGESFTVNESRNYDMIDVDDSIFKSKAYIRAHGKDYQATLSMLHSQLHQYIKPL